MQYKDHMQKNIKGSAPSYLNKYDTRNWAGKKINCNRQHSTAQHNTAQRSAAQQTS